MKKLSLILALLCLFAFFAFAENNIKSGHGNVMDLLNGSGNSGKCSDYEYREASAEYRGARLYKNGSPCDGDLTCTADMFIACDIKTDCDPFNNSDCDGKLTQQLNKKLKGHKEVNEKWQKRNKPKK